MKPEDIAKVCHEANRAYCETQGDTSQVRWEDAPQWQRDSAVNGVLFRMKTNATPAQMHQNWLEEKLVQGWRYGAVKDAEKKEHPCMLPYSKLPWEQKLKDHLFGAVFDALTYDDEE